MIQSSRSVLAVVLAAVLASCGGAGTGEPNAPSDVNGSEDYGGEGPGSAGTSVQARSPAERCSDGECVECGEGVCPGGYFCDESLSPAACSWIPKCVTDLTCGCLEESLGDDCRCEERGSGFFVDCS